jgi:hypothetical protein
MNNKKVITTYLHAGYTFDLTDKENQVKINELLGPYLTWTTKRGDKKVALKKEPMVAMSYYRDGNPKIWFDEHKTKSHLVYFKKFHYECSQQIAVLQGTTEGKPIYVVISRDMHVSPISIKVRISKGKFNMLPIDLIMPAIPYLYVQHYEKAHKNYETIKGKSYSTSSINVRE